jgi:NAD(P)-dependent dehydrogenase (short-subunit alcohol dehydrogenase family)
MEMKNAKTAVVTGGGTGVGKAVALALAGAGYQVVVAGRRQAPLDETCAEAQTKFGAGERMLGIATDVSDPVAVEQLFARTVQRFGRVDLLFNNAGRGNPPGSFLDWTPEQWREVVDVNLNGLFSCLQQAFRTTRPVAARRPHHPQRLHLRACAAPQFQRLHGHQACRHGADQDRGARRPRL